MPTTSSRFLILSRIPRAASIAKPFAIAKARAAALIPPRSIICCAWANKSRWHRIDATEIWHWYAGDVLELTISGPAGLRRELLGPHLQQGQRPQALVPAHHWQSARSLGAYTFVGCTVAPGFEF